MSAPLCLLVPVTGEVAELEPLLQDLRHVTQAGDMLVFACAGPLRSRDRDPARRVRLLAEMGEFPAGVRLHAVSLQAPLAWESLIEIGLPEFSGPDALPECVLLLSPEARVKPNGLLPLRQIMSEVSPPDLVTSATAGLSGEEVAAPFPLAFSRALIEGSRPRADGPTGMLGLLHHLLSQAARHRVSDLPTAPLPSPGAGLAQALAALSAEGPGAHEWVLSHLPAFCAGATPGARAVMAPVLSSANLPLPLTAPATPALAGRAMLRVWRGGAHAHRMPLAYDALAPLWEGQIQLDYTPEQADLLAIAHPLDALALAPDVAEAVARGVPAMLLSEEPFWDTLFSPDPLADRITLPASVMGEMRLHQVNHHRSGIFDFERIPYYLLTDPRFLRAYREHFARNARINAMDWAAAWGDRPADLVFMAERREERFHDIDIPEGGILGLCAWRTRLALACENAERLGASWQGGDTRFALEDWHLDKMTRLDGHARLLSAVENTRQPLYISEKIFDAFACGALPIYMGGPGHGIHRLELPEASWIDLWGADEQTGKARIMATLQKGADWTAYAAAQRRLAELFNDTEIAVRERVRIVDALRHELARAVDAGPA